MILRDLVALSHFPLEYRLLYSLTFHSCTEIKIVLLKIAVVCSNYLNQVRIEMKSCNAPLDRIELFSLSVCVKIELFLSILTV